MLERVKFDSVFQDKFFENQEESLLERDDIDFPLPESPQDLKSFLNNAKGQEFKSNIKKAISKISTWAEKNKIKVEPLIKFERTHLIEYSGSNAEHNTRAFTLYQLGMPLLRDIAKLIRLKKIPLEFRKNTIKNFITNLGICEDGEYSVILEAYSALKAQLNIAKMMMEIRHNISSQVCLELLKKYDIRQGLERHYVRGVLNRFADDLSIKMIEDSYVDLCEPQILNELFTKFQTEMPLKLTSVAVIDYIYADLNIEKLTQDLTHALKNKNTKQSNDKFSDFEMKLKFFGNEKEAIRAFKPEEIINDDYANLQPTWKAPYILKLSILSRLCASGFLNRKPFKSKKLFDDRVLHYFPGHSLTMAHVVRPAEYGSKIQSKPFLVFIAEEVFDGNHQHILARFIKHMPRQQKVEICHAIAQYAKSAEFAETSRSQQQIQSANELLAGLVPMKWKPVLATFASPDLDFIKALVEAGSDINKPDADGKTLLHRAIDLGSVDLIKTLLAKGAYPSRVLIYAATKGQADVVKALIEGGANLNQIDSHKMTALNTAAEKGHLEVVQLLLQHGANPNYLERCRESPLNYGIDSGRIDIVRALVKAGADVNFSVRNTLIGSPLCNAIKKKNQTIVKLLLKNGADATLASRSTCPLHCAAEAGSLRTFMLIVKSGVDVQQLDGFEATALHAAALGGNPQIIKKLAKLGVPLDSVNDRKITALIYAVQQPNVEAVKTLMDLGADINHQSEHGLMPLHFATKHPRNVQLLLEKGAKVDAMSEYGTTPLAAALGKNGSDSINILLDYGAKINHVDSSDGNTPLLSAINAENTEVVATLIARGANVNIANNGKAPFSVLYKKTPLEVALLRNNMETLKLLLLAGAKLGKSNIDHEKIPFFDNDLSAQTIGKTLDGFGRMDRHYKIKRYMAKNLVTKIKELKSKNAMTDADAAAILKIAKDHAFFASTSHVKQLFHKPAQGEDILRKEYEKFANVQRIEP